MGLLDAAEVGKRIRDGRKAKNLTQLQLAELLEVPQATVSYWESGKHPPSREDLPRVAKAIDIPLRDLVLDAEANGNTRATGG